jgi:hypothetical protein
MGSTDIQLARTHASRSVLARKQRVVGYRRVLSGSPSCDLCAEASTQRYSKEDLLPIHPGCSCDVEPIYGSSDPGTIADDQAIPDNAGQVSGTVQQHGEIGPVLAVKGQAFTGPDDLD